jgi:hypothetical protein
MIGNNTHSPHPENQRLSCICQVELRRSSGAPAGSCCGDLQLIVDQRLIRHVNVWRDKAFVWVKRLELKELESESYRCISQRFY